MTAYFVATYDITNPEGYAAYAPAVSGSMQEHDAEVLAADFESETLEGAPGKVTVILKFESKEAAKAWYNSPVYQGGVRHRLDNTEGGAVLVDGFVMPG